MRLVRTLAGISLALLLTTGIARAQSAPAGSHVVDRHDIDRALASSAATEQAQRDAVLRVLHRPEAQQVAARLGLSVKQAEDAVRILDAADLAAAADSANKAETAYAGGDTTIAISLTTLLLILILIVLIVK